MMMRESPFFPFIGIKYYINTFFLSSLPFLSRFLVSTRADLNEFWGRGDGKNYKEDKTIKPFKISYSTEVSTIFTIYAQISVSVGVGEGMFVWVCVHVDGREWIFMNICY